jgi:hypothetical protein
MERKALVDSSVAKTDRGGRKRKSKALVWSGSLGYTGELQERTWQAGSSKFLAPGDKGATENS